MSYRINIAKRERRRQWSVGMSEYVYKFYFRVDTEWYPLHPDKHNSDNNLTDLLGELREMYPEPKFKVDVYHHWTERQKVRM